MEPPHAVGRLGSSVEEDDPPSCCDDDALGHVVQQRREAERLVLGGHARPQRGQARIQSRVRSGRNIIGRGRMRSA